MVEKDGETQTSYINQRLLGGLGVRRISCPQSYLHCRLGLITVILLFYVPNLRHTRHLSVVKSAFVELEELHHLPLPHRQDSNLVVISCRIVLF